MAHSAEIGTFSSGRTSERASPRHAPPGKQQESTRPAATGFDFGSNADAREMLGTGSGEEEESSLLLDECTDEKALLEAKPGAPVRDARPPATEEEVEEEVVAEVVEKEAPVACRQARRRRRA